MNTDSRKELIPDIKQLLDNPVPQPESNAASSSSSELNVDPKTFMTDNSFTNPLYISVVMIGLILIVTLIVYLGGIGSTTETNSLGVETTNDNIALKVIFAIAIFLLVLYITQYVLYYYFGVDITTNLANMFKPNKDPTIDINIDKSNELPTPPPKPEPEPVDQDEVFNVRDNVYTYDDAKLVCDAYDSKLATYSQVEETYNKGGEWCNYGWSADQLALFPTQSSTYNELMKTKDHKHDCGRPGVNGGYIANPNVRFGVNCYGKKPAITKEEEEMMKNITPYPKNQKEEEIEETVNKWKNNLDDILVSPFNYGQWNE